MYVSELKLAGFKSFADRTHLSLRQGVAVIVGPNGSGKSNLVDAIAWVMGTQSPKALRTHKMDDVIFAGTATRPALGRAEVTLVFDNQEGVLPLDLDEVSITRRLYRDGTSEYLIAGTECRLTDIQELLSDSGVGRHQHTIVSQGEIDAILSADAADHRAVIEEAAGVLKHRVRKERAIRRLERTDGDLLRLGDIERELKRQIRPLRRQAKAAERYEEMRAEARALRLYTDGQDLSRVGDQLASAQEEDGALQRRSEAASAELARTTAALSALKERVAKARSTLEIDTTAAARLETSYERFQRIAQVAHERISSANLRVAQASERITDLQAEKKELVSALDTDRTARQQLTAELSSATSEAASLAEEEKVLTQQASMSAEGVTAMLRGEIAGLERSDARDGVEQSELETKLGVLNDHLDLAKRDRQRLEAEIQALDTQASAAGRVYSEARESRVTEQDKWEAAEERLAEAKLGEAAARAGVAALEDASTRPRTGDALETPGVAAHLMELLDCPPSLVAAVRAALGAWADAVALEPGRDIAAVVTELNIRGVRGVPVVGSDPGALGDTRAERARQWGLEPLVSRLGAGANSELAQRLLGDVLLVESWSAGWQVVTREEGVRAVTPEGDLISIEGISLHDAATATPQLLAEARDTLEAATTEVARRASLLTGARRSFDRSRESEREALEELERTEALLAGATEALDRAVREEAEREAERDLLGRRLAEVTETIRDRAAQLADLRDRLAKIEKETPFRARLREEATHRRNLVAARRRVVEANRDEAATNLAAASERAKLREARLGTISEEIRSFEVAPTAVGRAEELSQTEQAARAALSVVSAHVSVLRERQRTERAELTEAERQLASDISNRDSLSAEADEMRERRSSLAVQLTEYRLRVESIAEGLRRDLDATPEDAVAAPLPALEPETSPHARLEELEAQLRRIGPVNPLAAEEYRELADRAAFLTAQISDVESSRRKLSGLIATLDTEITELFRAAYEQVAAYFEENFQLLFPGGRGRLKLTEPDDLLSTGVDILAQPMGKKVSRLSLLSGGEKSLAALAFLFAVFRARPSPFYLLDEVEAALDDANLRRFLRLLDEVRFDAQLIIVTHQTQTMEAADVLYGITLEPGGSTQVVAKQLVPV